MFVDSNQNLCRQVDSDDKHHGYLHFSHPKSFIVIHSVHILQRIPLSLSLSLSLSSPPLRMRLGTCVSTAMLHEDEHTWVGRKILVPNSTVPPPECPGRLCSHRKTNKVWSAGCSRSESCREVDLKCNIILPNPLMSSVKTPGSLSIKHQSPADMIESKSSFDALQFGIL